MLLKRIDIDQIGRVLRQRGFASWEIYAESRTLTRVTAEERIIATRSATTAGISLRVFATGGVRQFSTSRLDTEGVLAALSEADTGPAPTDGHTPPCELEATQAQSQRLNHLVRTTWQDSEGVRLNQLCFDAETRDFESISEQGSLTRGREEWAGATAEWTLNREGKSVAAREELWASGIDTFLDAWEKRNPFRARTERLLRQTIPWPAPAGEVPIYWSAAAVARLAHLFLRAFEGDLVLDNMSFLTDITLPLPLPFSIVETAPSVESVDHEGSLRRTVPLFRDGQPRSLACNRRVAEQMSVPSTGHCRRQSYLHAPQVGLWHPIMHGDKVVASPLAQLSWGIGIGEFAVESFDPSTGEVVLHLTDARLLHQGELGEAIEVLRWSTNLLTLLGSFSSLGDTPETFGFPTQKKGSRWVTDLSAPAALSPSLSLPGSVPPGHYW